MKKNFVDQVQFIENLVHFRIVFGTNVLSKMSDKFARFKKHFSTPSIIHHSIFRQPWRAGRPNYRKIELRICKKKTKYYIYFFVTVVLVSEENSVNKEKFNKQLILLHLDFRQSLYLSRRNWQAVEWRILEEKPGTTMFHFLPFLFFMPKILIAMREKVHKFSGEIVHLKLYPVNGKKWSRWLWKTMSSNGEICHDY